MRIDKVKIKNFKNLKDATIDFDESQTISVVIGKNGAGKSNLLEALIIIFRDLDLDEDTTQFDYEISYCCKEHNIEISSYDGKRIIKVHEDAISKSQFKKKKDEYLPSNVFAYYSGNEKRMEEHFARHQQRFYDEMLKKREGKFRRLFYARPVHSNFVLLAFFALVDKGNTDFLKKYLDIDSLESVLFVTHKPEWAKTKINTTKSEFWGSRGYVREFLDEIYNLSLAPLIESVKVPVGIKKTKTTEFIYLYLKDQKSLRELAGKYNTDTEFFKYIESTYLSDLIEEVRIKVKKTDDSVVTFNELSEGEQQLLTVLGLMKFTEKEEALFLLDEPDTHLNPKWKFEYLQLIEDISGKNENSQVILSTHDPIVISGLEKETITIFDKKDGITEIRQPEKNPRGMGIAGLLTSDLFDLPTALDSITQDELDEKRRLTFKKDKTQDEKKRLKSLDESLEKLGFTMTTRDPLYSKFLERLYERDEIKDKEPTEIDREELSNLIDGLLKEIMAEE
jgi:SMC domain protein